MAHQRMVREPEQKKPYSLLRASVTESAANTYTEASVTTPVSAAYFQAMRVHKVIFDLSNPDGVEDVRTQMNGQLTTRTQTGIVGAQTEGFIAATLQERRWVSSAAGGESEVFETAGRRPALWDFGEQGILVTDGELRLGILGSGNTGSGKVCAVIIYYTLETLEPSEYIAALSVLGAQL